LSLQAGYFGLRRLRRQLFVNRRFLISNLLLLGF
jgi:hypothetical protein